MNTSSNTNRKRARPSVSETWPAACPMCGQPMPKNTLYGDFEHVRYNNGCLLEPVKGDLMDIERWNEFCKRLKK